MGSHSTNFYHYGKSVYSHQNDILRMLIIAIAMAMNIVVVTMRFDSYDMRDMWKRQQEKEEKNR